ncbi:MAG TPA: gamma carbonic anhydrase family protein [Candidatus Baltobacteraceae bacterium]|nr:gamma carbonic anhydrase family protein [Candidatus Baltobacteraceae bacterium]
MILSSGTKKPKIHPSAYIAPSATISGEVTVGQGCAILHGAVIVAEGAPLTLGADCVVMENAVIKASGGSATRFPVKIGDRCIVGPHAYVVGATIGSGCFIASGSRVFNGAVMEDGSGVALGGIVHVNARLLKNASVPMQHIAYGNPAKIVPPEKAPEAARDLQFYENVFNIDSGEGARAKAAQAYAQFLRKAHAQDAVLDAHANKAPARRSAGEEPPKQQTTEVDTVVDAMMLELQEMEMKRQEALKKKPKR